MQGISPLTVELSHVDRASGHYPFNITHGELLRVGSQIQNISIAPGDNSLSVSDISITENLVILLETCIFHIKISCLFLQIQSMLNT